MSGKAIVLDANILIRGVLERRAHESEEGGVCVDKLIDGSLGLHLERDRSERCLIGQQLVDQIEHYFSCDAERFKPAPAPPACPPVQPK